MDIQATQAARDRARLVQEHSHIEGWGADLAESDRPAVPMERTPPRLEHVPWDQPPQQEAHVPVFVSPERPAITPVFGSTAPPRGLSGAMRAAAYKMTENDVRHWLLLMLADRVDVVEGIGDDLLHGHIPNIFGEMGIRAELRHNPAGLARKAAVTAAVAGVTWYLLARRRRS